MSARSAGILLHRVRDGRRQVLIVHPGGPWWAGRDAGAWSIPKGEFLPPEDPWTAARREFAEEIALPVPDGDVLDLGRCGWPPASGCTPSPSMPSWISPGIGSPR